MARIAYCWERGAGFGHIVGFLPIARHLEEKGHEVVYIVKDLINTHALIGQYGFKVFQAPLWQMKVKNLPEPVNYAETLFRFGYLFEERLLDMVMGWKNLLQNIVPNLVLFDHSPTALLASRSISTKRVLLGTGYCNPPRIDPMPAILSWSNPSLQRLQSSENRALKSINGVLERIDAPSLEKFMDLFDCDENILTTFPELDHYQDREPIRYWGPYMSADEGVVPVWPDNGKGKKIFVYLREEVKSTEKVLQVLQDLKAEVLVYVVGLSSALVERFQTERLVFFTELLNLKEVCRECDLIICHAGHATVSRALLEGVPVVLLPFHAEQLITSKNIVRLGAGTMVDYRDDEPDYAAAVNRALEDNNIKEKVQEFAARYADFDQEQQTVDIINCLEGLLTSAS